MVGILGISSNDVEANAHGKAPRGNCCGSEPGRNCNELLGGQDVLSARVNNGGSPCHCFAHLCLFLFVHGNRFVPGLGYRCFGSPDDGQFFVLYMVLVGIFVAFNLYRLEPPEIGTIVASNATVDDTVRRQLIFHLQDDDGSPMPLRNWTLLDPDEKIRVKMEFKGPDVVPLRYRDDDSIEKSNWVYMDVERKGQERPVPNLNMECLEQDEDDAKFDGQDCRIFEVLDEYEDWWVTFGYPADPLHFRQMVANELRLTPSVLVDVYTQHSPN